MSREERTAAEFASSTGPNDGGDSIVARWDAGGLGCGELVLGLRTRLADVPPGSLFEVLATDAGAPRDLPSWCRLTGHELARVDPPLYVIRKRVEE